MFQTRPASSMGTTKKPKRRKVGIGLELRARHPYLLKRTTASRAAEPGACGAVNVVKPIAAAQQQRQRDDLDGLGTSSGAVQWCPFVPIRQLIVYIIAPSASSTRVSQISPSGTATQASIEWTAAQTAARRCCADSELEQDLRLQR